MKTSKRLTILSNNEINDLYALPIFSDRERQHYFALNPKEMESMNSLGTTNTKLYFTLLVGYFKAKPLFFDFQFNEVQHDVNFIMRQYFPEKVTPNKIPSKNVITSIRKTVAGLTQFVSDKHYIDNTLEKLALDTCRTALKPKIIFDRLMIHMAHHAFVLPKYSTLQDLIGRALINEENRLKTLMKNHLPQYAKTLLDELLTTKENYYEVSLLKKDQKNFSYSQIRKAIAFKKSYNQLFKCAQKLLPKMKINASCIDYYASLIGYYPVAQLRDLPIETSYLYLICYIYKRLLKLNDNLMTSFLYTIDKYKKSAKEHGKECVYQFKGLRGIIY